MVNDIRYCIQCHDGYRIDLTDKNPDRLCPNCANDFAWKDVFSGPPAFECEELPIMTGFSDALHTIVLTPPQGDGIALIAGSHESLPPDHPIRRMVYEDPWTPASIALAKKMHRGMRRSIRSSRDWHTCFIMLDFYPGYSHSHSRKIWKELIERRSREP